VQRVLDALPTSPAYVKTPAWDIVAWNAAALAVLADYAAMPAHERNILRRLFGDPAARASLPDWEGNARFALAVFRIEMARTGGSPEAAALVAELQARSADFRRLWAENAMHGHGIGMKQLQHSVVGPLTLEYSAFTVDGADGLSMVVFTPATPADARKIDLLLSRGPATPPSIHPRPLTPNGRE